MTRALPAAQPASDVAPAPAASAPPAHRLRTARPTIIAASPAAGAWPHPFHRESARCHCPNPMKPAELFPALTDDLAEVDRVIRDAARLRGGADQHDVRLHHRRRRQADAAGAGAADGARARLRRRAHHHLLAAVVEFIHTATLLHDDVVDESALRRGRDTANAAFGNAASVLVGDFLYSRAFQMMVEADDMRVMQRAGRRDQHDRRRRGAAADQLQRPRRGREPLPAGDPLQDGQAVRGGRAAGCDPVQGAAPRSKRRPPPTAGTWAPRSSWSTTCSTTRDTPATSARTWATTCARASRRCR